MGRKETIPITLQIPAPSRGFHRVDCLWPISREQDSSILWARLRSEKMSHLGLFHWPALRSMCILNLQMQQILFSLYPGKIEIHFGTYLVVIGTITEHTNHSAVRLILFIYYLFISVFIYFSQDLVLLSSSVLISSA